MPKKIMLFFTFFFLWASGVFSNEAQDFIVKGNSFVEQKKYEEAIQEYRKAIKSEPKNAKPLLLAGLASAHLGNFDDAVSDTKKAAELDPSYSAFYHLGMIYAAAKDAPKALEAYDRALALNPDSFTVEYQKGLVLSSQGEQEKAIESFQKAAKLNPRLVDVHIALAGAYLKLGDQASALAQAEELRNMKQETLAQALEKRIKEKAI